MAKLQKLATVCLVLGSIILATLWLRSYKQSVEYKLLSDQRKVEAESLRDRNKQADKAIASLASSYDKFVADQKRLIAKLQKQDDSIKSVYDTLKPKVLELVKLQCPPEVNLAVEDMMNACEARVTKKTYQLMYANFTIDSLSKFRDSVLKIDSTRSKINLGLDTLFKAETKAHKGSTVKITVVAALSGLIGYLIGK